MVASKIQKSAAVAAESLIWDFIIKGVMVASNVQHSKSAAGAAEFWILDFGIKDVIVGNQIQNSKIGRCRGRFSICLFWC